MTTRDTLPLRELLGWQSRDEGGRDERRRAPRITAFSPGEVGPGDRISVEGLNLDGCTVALGAYGIETVESNVGRIEARVPASTAEWGTPLSGFALMDLAVDVEPSLSPLSSDELAALSLRELLRPGERVSLVVFNDVGASLVPGAIELDPGIFEAVAGSPGSGQLPTSRTFAGSTVQALIEPIGLNQRYLVLSTRGRGTPRLPATTDPSYFDTLQRRVEAGGNHLGEASFQQSTFVFDVHRTIVPLPDPLSTYYVRARPKRISGRGATFPAPVDGETLTVEGDGFAATTTFSSTRADGTLDLRTIVAQIRAAIETQANSTSIPATFDAGTTERFGRGQLRLFTLSPGRDADLAVTGGSARTALGLDRPVISPGVDGKSELVQLAGAALTEYVRGMTAARARDVLEEYDGLIVVQTVSDETVRASASLGNWPIAVDLPGGEAETYELGVVHLSAEDDSTVVAHEIGHNMGFPDLYDEPGAPEFVGEELTAWDLMANSADLHPGAWIKTWKSGHARPASTEPTNRPWIPESDVAVVRRPPLDGTTVTKDLLLVSASLPQPPSGPGSAFATVYPGIDVVRAVRFDFRDASLPHDPEADEHGWHVYLEAREANDVPYNPLFPDHSKGATHDTDTPLTYRHGDPNSDSGAVIVTDAVNVLSDEEASVNLPVYRTNATLLGGPLTDVNDQWSRSFPGGDQLTVRVTEVIPGDPTVTDSYPYTTTFRLAIEWGPGPEPGTTEADLWIRKWDAPPYESRDIWLDAAWENDWGEYFHPLDTDGTPTLNGDRIRPDEPTRVYARIHNEGPNAAEDVEVEFSVVVPAGNGPGVPIGTDTISRIEPGMSGLARVVWVPSDDNDSHVCLQASIVGARDDPDPNLQNNTAQENVTDWYLERRNPYEPVPITVEVHNPLSRRTHCQVIATGLREGYYLDVDPATLWLDPGGTARIDALLRADSVVPLDAEWLAMGEEPPIASIEFQLQYGCSWIPIAGVSGTVHTVERVDLSTDVTTGLDPDGHSKIGVDITVETADSVAANAPVTVRLADDDGRIVAIERSETDADGTVSVTIDYDDLSYSDDSDGADDPEDPDDPDDCETDPRQRSRPSGREFHMDVFVSPTTRTGPAETASTVVFADEDDRASAA